MAILAFVSVISTVLSTVFHGPCKSLIFHVPRLRRIFHGRCKSLKTNAPTVIPRSGRITSPLKGESNSLRGRARWVALPAFKNRLSPRCYMAKPADQAEGGQG